MSKKIHTFQSSDRKVFDEQVNQLLEYGCELLDGSYAVIKKKKRHVYSQVVEIDTNNCDVEFYANGQVKYLVHLKKNGKKDGQWTEWHTTGEKKSEGAYKDGKQDGLWTHWLENGQIRSRGTYKDGKWDGLWTWFENLEKYLSETYKDGKKDGLKDRKSTRLNSSHVVISYAVFCLKKKKKKKHKKKKLTYHVRLK